MKVRSWLKSHIFQSTLHMLSVDHLNIDGPPFPVKCVRKFGSALGGEVTSRCVCACVRAWVSEWYVPRPKKMLRSRSAAGGPTNNYYYLWMIVGKLWGSAYLQASGIKTSILPYIWELHEVCPGNPVPVCNTFQSSCTSSTKLSFETSLKRFSRTPQIFPHFLLNFFQIFAKFHQNISKMSTKLFQNISKILYVMFAVFSAK